MTEPNAEQEPAERVGRLADAAAGLGVEFNAGEARQWMLAVSGADREGGVVTDAQSGIFGHQIALADFDTADLDYFRRLARRVRVESRPGVETALAIAGSSAQGKVQVFPGDADFFERVNIHASDEAGARAVLAELLRATALRAMAESDVVLVEANFGVYPVPVTHNGAAHTAGDSILWSPGEVLAGVVEAVDANGQPLRLEWNAVQGGLGWSYLGWIVADRELGRIALASNMLDVTWEAADGRITPLDGAIDAWFQEIYLEPEAIPVFTKIARHVEPGALQSYADSMRWQVQHYTRAEPSYCKATKRLYNLFRLTDQLEAAAYLRELFDEPGAGLYQADGLLEAARLAYDAGSGIERSTVIAQIDRVVQAVETALEGPDEAELVHALTQLRDRIAAGGIADAAWGADLQSIQARCRALVNEYFRVRIFGLPQIADYVAAL